MMTSGLDQGGRVLNDSKKSSTGLTASHRISLLLVAILASLSARSHAQAEMQSAVQAWAKGSLHPLDAGAIDAPTRDLQPLRKMIGDSKVLALSEPVHGAAEPLEFRNRLFKYLVQELGFTVIAIESGIVESRLVNEYVVDGRGDFETVLKQGLTWTFDAFPQNRELIRWMRDYNARLPQGRRKIRFYGFDVSGSPGNLSATRGPDTAIEVALAYLRTVDPQAAARITDRVAAFLPTLKRSKYEEISQADRNSITTAIEDLISLIQHRRFQYLSKSSNDDYEWAERSAIAARQVDTWWRHMPLAWKVADGFEWTRDASQTRERAMADNLEWIIRRLDSHERILLYGAVSHIATAAFRFTDAPERDMFSFGAHAKARLGSEVVSILTLAVNGEIAFCSGAQRKPFVLKPPPDNSIESVFGSVNVPRFILDLRNAPPSVSSWLHQTQDHWNGFGTTRFAVADAFDLAYFVSPIRPACPVPSPTQ